MAIISISFMSMSLMREVSAKVILPTGAPGFARDGKPFKTVYFLPGYSASAEAILTCLGMRNQAELKELAVVIPDGENAFYTDVPERNGRHSTYVAKELVDFTRQIFPLSCKREETYIAGISMGGFGALYNGLRYPKTFSKVAALSPASDLYQVPEVSGLTPALMDHYFGSREAYENSDADIKTAYLKDRERPELWLGCGRSDILTWEMDKELHERLDKAGIAHTWFEIDGNHDIYTWECMLDSAFSFLAGIEPGTRDKLKL